MLRNSKRGLSTVVTTLIIILLVLVAIGIVWVVVRGLIEDTSVQVGSKTDCIGAQVDIKSISCSTTGCTVSIQRLSGGSDAVDGAKAVVTIGSESVSGTITGGFGVLETKNINANGTLTAGSDLLATITAAPMIGTTTVCDTVDTDTETVTIA